MKVTLELTEQQLEKIKQEYNLVKETEYKPWKPEIDEEYWYVRSDGYIDNNNWDDFSFCDGCLGFGNVFKTEEEAKQARDYLKAMAKIKLYTKGFVPNWGDKKQLKYTIDYNHCKKTFDVHYDSYVLQSVGTIYFPTKEDRDYCIKDCEKELKIVLGIK